MHTHQNFGYTISFDVKVAGIYKDTNTVKIKPRFYYLSKDGTVLNENIILFYKNSDGKYVKIGSESDNYKLSYKPNDPYRLKEESTRKHLLSSNITLKSLTEFYLIAKETSTSKEVVTQGFEGAVTTYYGEYKLPNTTIAVEVNEKGEYNINSPLANGYIGVIFDMSAGSITDNVFDESTSYVNKADITDKFGGMWQLENYYGGKTEFKLEKATIAVQIHNKETGAYTYTDFGQKMLGTVILYDADARASDDYN